MVYYIAIKRKKEKKEERERKESMLHGRWMHGKMSIVI